MVFKHRNPYCILAPEMGTLIPCTIAKCRILHKTESTWRHLDTIQPHDHSPDVPRHGEELVDLLFSGVERQVTNIQCCGCTELFLVFFICKLAK